MKKPVLCYILFLTLVCTYPGYAQTLSGGKLIDLIPGLYGGDGISLATNDDLDAFVHGSYLPRCKPDGNSFGLTGRNLKATRLNAHFLRTSALYTGNLYGRRSGVLDIEFSGAALAESNRAEFQRFRA